MCVFRKDKYIVSRTSDTDVMAGGFVFFVFKDCFVQDSGKSSRMVFLRAAAAGLGACVCMCCHNKTTMYMSRTSDIDVLTVKDL